MNNFKCNDCGSGHTKRFYEKENGMFSCTTLMCAECHSTDIDTLNICTVCKAVEDDRELSYVNTCDIVEELTGYPNECVNHLQYVHVCKDGECRDILKEQIQSDLNLLRRRT